MIKLNKFVLSITVLLAINLIQMIESKRIFWPPITSSEHTNPLEIALKENLEKGCPNKDNKLKPGTQPEHFFAITFTQNFGLSNPIPMQFTHIASGYQINFNTSCEDCKANEFFFDGIAYKTTNFECRNLCIFVAQEINGKCKNNRRNYRVLIPFGHRHLEISEACHRLGNIEDLKRSKDEKVINLDILRKFEYEYIGEYSKKVFFEGPEEKKCTRKCLPVCRQPVIGGDDFDSDDDFVSYDKTEVVTENIKNMNKMDDERVNVNEYVANFVRNLCNYNKSKSSLYESYRLMDLNCNSSNTISISILNILIVLINLIIFKVL
ncbi:uncharacterized protein LOC129606571 [Condylostylus longicornis]|uniref:uncharacterized protein LOC129606571 n=1 Tax=Condylostylus longicornis TaxID=2530218 RepID=UPI00244E3CAA|nr:uncharacterized protein LOC129606571 [Condylostylus longicornis]